MFEKVLFKDVQNLIYEKLSTEGALIVAGTLENHNNMTIGWATHGVLWSKPVIISYVKPTRYTFDFCNSNDTFSICYFDDRKDILKECGTKSGRDVNKDDLCSLHPITLDETTCYQEASLIITCRKIYQDDFYKEHFLDESIIEKRYQDGLIHRFYIGEVINVYKKTN